jgi:FlaA1/EpsC-like NDP-sugar epimerase
MPAQTDHSYEIRGLARRMTYSLGMIVADVLVVVSAVALAYLARFDGSVPASFQGYVLPAGGVAAAVFPLVFLVFGLYGYIWRHVGVGMVVRVGAAVVLAAAACVALDFGFARPGLRPVPLGAIAIAAAFVFIGATAIRAVARLGVYVRFRGAGLGARRVLIVGAGDAGSLLLRDIETSPTQGINVVGFVDDDTSKRGRRVRSARVLGSIEDIPQIVAANSVEEILVALPSVGPVAQGRVLDHCANAGVAVRLMPSVVESAGAAGLRDLRRVEVADLLGRDCVPVNIGQIESTISGKVVAVTGAAGSIGSELCRQLLTLNPLRLVMIEIDESRLYEVFLELAEIAPGVPEMHICDIRDDRKLGQVIEACRPDMVLHAAAYKHVPLMEIEPDEAVKTNVVGTRNLIGMCERYDVGSFVLISTDKAVSPQSVMGLTKALAERITLDAGRRGLRTTCVRFGNVLGSRGSVVPLFEEQLRRGGPLLVTHPDVTRYFMTIPEASLLVLQAQALSEGGEVYVLEMGEPVRIVDLAQKMISLSGVNTSIEFTGLRPAEKMHEVLIQGEEELAETGASKVLRVTALPVLPENLDSVVHALGVFARLNDRLGMRSCFARLVPAFEGEGANALGYLDEQESLSALDAIDPNMETLF